MADAYTTVLILPEYSSTLAIESVSRNNTTLADKLMSMVTPSPFNSTNYSLKCNANGAALPIDLYALMGSSTIPYDIGTGIFTIEAFVDVSNTQNGFYILDATNLSNANEKILFFLTSGDNIQFYVSTSIFNYVSLLSSQSIYNYGKSSGFVHVAISFDGSVYRLFINGVLAESLTTSAIAPTNGALTNAKIFRPAHQNVPYYSLVSNFRISKGIARYTAAFTPPTDAFPSYRELSQTGSLSLTIDPTAAKNKFNINGLVDGTGSINGTVTNKGVGVSTTVRLYSTQGQGSLLATTTSDASGNFSFSTLVVGVNYFVVATHGTFPNRSGKIVTAA